MTKPKSTHVTNYSRDTPQTHLVRNIWYQQRSAGTKSLQAEAASTGHTKTAHVVSKDTQAQDPLAKLPRDFPNSNRTQINGLDMNAKTDSSVCLSERTEDCVRGRIRVLGTPVHVDQVELASSRFLILAKYSTRNRN